MPLLGRGAAPPAGTGGVAWEAQVTTCLLRARWACDAPDKLRAWKKVPHAKWGLPRLEHSLTGRMSHTRGNGSLARRRVLEGYTEVRIEATGCQTLAPFPVKTSSARLLPPFFDCAAQLT